MQQQPRLEKFPLMPNRPLRVLHVVATSIGGDWFYQQVTGLARLGNIVQVVLPGDGPLADRLRDAGIGVEIIPFKGKEIRHQLRVATAEIRLARFIRSFQPDVIHAHLLKAILCCRLAASFYPKALRVAQVPGSIHLHSRPYRLLDQWTLSRDDLIIGSCQAIASHYRAAGARSVAVSYYGFDVHHLDPLTSGSAFRREFGLADDVPTVGMLAHMYPTQLRAFQAIGTKGHEVFLDSAALLLKRMPEVQIFVIGDEFPVVGDNRRKGDYRRRLEKRAAVLGITRNVHFTGHRSDIACVLAGLDVVVGPSIEESACGAMVEALLMRRSVVASNVGGLPDTVQHGVSGLLVPPRDPAALADAVAELIADPLRREEMGRQGRDHCLRRFDMKVTVAQVQALYLEALDRKRTKRGL
jgi:glycosyltransferase involved in cell wall biosynthesis